LSLGSGFGRKADMADSAQEDRLAERIRQLFAGDEQFQNAKPDLALQASARQPNLRLPQILEMFVNGPHWAGGRVP
jgi:hypothetical protein